MVIILKAVHFNLKKKKKKKLIQKNEHIISNSFSIVWVLGGFRRVKRKSRKRLD